MSEWRDTTLAEFVALQSSGHQRIPSECFSAFLLAVPTPAAAHHFDQLIAPLMAKSKANSTETRTLATLRDTLLPKLLSGVLSVANLQKEVSA